MTDISMRILLSAVGGAGVVSAMQSIAQPLLNDLPSAFEVSAVAALGLGAAVVGIGALAVNASGDFQNAMDQNVAHAGLATDQVNNVNSALLAMGPAVGQGPTALAQALYPILSGFSGITDQSAKTQVSLAELDDAAKSVAGTTTSVTDASNAGTAAFNAYGMATDDANTNIARMNNMFDIMNSTVSAGNMQWGAYSTVIGRLSVAAHGAGVSFVEENAALADMTNQGFSADLASRYLSNTFTDLYTKADNLKKNADKLGISFDENKYKTMDFGQRLQYLRQVTDDNQSSLLKLMGGNSIALKTFDALSDSIGNYQSNLDSLNHSQGATEKAFETASSGFNFSMQKLQAAGQALLITIGSGLLPILTTFVNNAIIPAASYVADFANHANVLIPILIGVGTVIAAVVLPPLISLIGVAIEAAAPFVLVAAAIAGAVWIFMHFYQTSAPFKAFIDNIVSGIMHIWGIIQANFIPVMMRIGEAIQKYVFPFLMQIGQYIASQFVPLWKQLVDLWQSQLLPLFKMIQPHLGQIMLALEALGIVIGVIVVVSIGLLIGMITGLAKGLATFLGGLITFVAGFIQYFTGMAQFFTGIVNFIVDLATGKFGKLGGDLGLIWTGIQNMFSGAWKMIVGLFQMSFGTIISFTQGFIDGVIKFFTTLYHDLVGHSIIPDMINGIITWFNVMSSALMMIVETIINGIVDWFWKLVNDPINAVRSMKDQALSIISDLASSAYNAGANIVNNIASGIIGSIGSALGNAMGQVGQYISDHLPHSPAKLGPLKDLMQQGSLITQQIAQGVQAGLPQLQSSLSLVLQPVASTLGGNIAPSGNYAPQGHTIIYAPQISISTMARSISEVERLVDMIEDELSKRFRGQTSGYASGGVY